MKLRFAVLFLMVLISKISYAQTLESTIETIYNEYQLMGISLWVSAEDDTQTIHFGKRDLNRNLDINDNTKFRIASISKAVTALGLLKLYDQGLLSLDDDISDAMGYTIRNPSFPNQPITYRMLLSHQSSLIDGDGYNAFLDTTFSDSAIPNISELLVPGGNYYTSNMWLNTSPGSYFSYSNINFGLIGTLIEKLSGIRFDAYMKSEILEPLNTTASFNVYDLPNIDDLAVLYRYNNGWQPQVDNYQGNLPTPPDLSNYQIGTNGLLFGPQGGLRASTLELSEFIETIAGLNTNNTLEISQTVLDEMNTPQWTYNGSNGNNYFGLFNSWGLGLHIANGTGDDAICNLGDYDSFIGHPGEAYGLISDAFYEIENDSRFTVLINGSLNGYTVGSTAFYTVEDAIFEALCNYFESVLDTDSFSEKKTTVFPNPTKDYLNIAFKQPISKVSTEILNLNGQLISKALFYNTANANIAVKHLKSGIYFVKIKTVSREEVLKFVIQ